MTVWTVYKLSPTGSRIRETLKFLLDHPRRCFVYLFPSTQTYVLACVMVSL
jgi:Trk-type K+ transport system membrane component